jgi:hypothetical protein
MRAKPAAKAKSMEKVMSSSNRIARVFAMVAAIVLAAVAVPRAAHAAVTGTIEGVVTDGATGKKLAGVTITVTSPALQGEQTEFTDADGHWMITELPPGEYLVRFYFANLNIERPGVHVQPDKTLSINVVVPTQKAEVKTVRIVETAPNVDVGNTQVQTSVTSELVRNTPVAGRTYQSVLTMAPGSATDAVGNSFNGATGPENNFLIDGANTTDPGFGLIGTQLSIEFIGETEIITGGYNAEYGRATGAVVNVITKSGSNNFHGDIWFNVTPFQLNANLVGRLGEAITRRTRTKYGFDFGFDLAGPIVKDKIWFYVGFQPTFTTNTTERLLRARTANDLPDSQTMGSYQGDLDASISCPAGLNRTFCNTPGLLAPGYATTPLGNAFGKNYDTNNALYNWIVKFNFQLNQNNSLVAQYIGSPFTSSGPINPFGTLNGADSNIVGTNFVNTHDALLHFVSKVLDRRLQLDVQANYHYSKSTFTPDAKLGGNDASALYDNVNSLDVFEPAVTPCAPQTLHGAGFLPCPVQNYVAGGWGFVQNTTSQRWSVQAAGTYFARLGGTHALKLGFDFEDNIYRDERNYTGGIAYEVGTAGDISVGRQFASKDPNNPPDGPGISFAETGFNVQTHTLNYGAYLRDSYNVGFVPGLTVNAGVRYEAQQVKDINGNTAIGIYDNWAPRVGAIYDFTRKGRSKIYASYGWFYESIPLDINDRAFSGEGTVAPIAPGGTCTADARGIYDLKTCSPVAMPSNQNIVGGTFAKVAPKLQGMYSEEVVAGVQYDVGLDLVLGASYQHRDLGRIVEDVSPDGGNNYLISNPGQAPDAGAIKDLQKQIAATSDMTKKQELQQTLALYQNVNNGFPKPVRNYDALVITATKRLSHNFLVLASYTYSRTLGNYPGTFQNSNGQLDPNISTQYDIRELLFNRNGPLPNDRPHNFKVQGSYFVPFGANTMVFGLAFTALSGTPIEVLGRHPLYGLNEVYILPRGSGGRMPMLTQLDLHVAYRRQLSRLFGFEASADVFNIANQQQVTAVDEQYTASNVNPIQNGKVSDLATLRGINGTQPLLNPNYGRPTAYQAPLSMRLGLRLSF